MGIVYTSNIENGVEMKNKHKYVFKYNDSVLKNGYEEMAKINLGFAESGLLGDAQDLVSYEKNLANNLLIQEGDNFDD